MKVIKVILMGLISIIIISVVLVPISMLFRSIHYADGLDPITSVSNIKDYVQDPKPQYDPSKTPSETPGVNYGGDEEDLQTGVGLSGQNTDANSDEDFLGETVGEANGEVSGEEDSETQTSGETDPNNNEQLPENNGEVTDTDTNTPGEGTDTTGEGTDANSNVTDNTSNNTEFNSETSTETNTESGTPTEENAGSEENNQEEASGGDATDEQGKLVVYTENDLYTLNQSNTAVEVEKVKFGGIEYISKFVGICGCAMPTSEEDYLNPGISMSGVIGLENGAEELKYSKSASTRESINGTAFVYSQRYNGYDVLGGKLTVFYEEDSHASRMESSIYPTSILKNVDYNISYSESDAVDIADEAYGENFVANEKVRIVVAKSTDWFDTNLNFVDILKGTMALVYRVGTVDHNGSAHDLYVSATNGYLFFIKR